MPLYEYQCEACEVIFETFESMTEHGELPIPHCPKCDPLQENKTTMERYMGNCRPSFRIEGGGVYSPGWH
jgi:putative FmdB family regulatory protein